MGRLNDIVFGDDLPEPYPRARFGLSTDTDGPTRCAADLRMARESAGAWACAGTTLDSWPGWFCAELVARILTPTHNRRD